MNKEFSEKKEYSICSATGKRCYNKKDAGRIINSCYRHRSSDHLGRNKVLPRRKYFCTECRCYHLTHMPFYYDKGSHNGAWEEVFYQEYNKKNRKKPAEILA